MSFAENVIWLPKTHLTNKLWFYKLKTIWKWVLGYKQTFNSIINV